MAISPIREQPEQTVDIVAIVVKISLAPPAVGDEYGAGFAASSNPL
jgi:hypothetical protein